MNIVVVDVQSLNTSLPEPVSEIGPESDNFTDLMDQHLYQDAELTTQVEYPQVIDNKELLLNEGMPSEVDDLLLQGSASSRNWLEDLAGKNPGMTTELPAEPISVDISQIKNSIQIENPAEFGNIAIQATSPANGDLLPANGKTLPLSEIRPDNQAMALPAQENLQALNRSMFTDPSKPLSAEIDPETVRQSTDMRPVDLVSKPNTFQAPGFIKADSAVEDINFAARLEFQMANPGLQDNADFNNSQIRTLASFNANLPLQQSSPALPPQLETLAVTNPRDTGAWGTGLGERINWMINQKLNTATIRMDPPMLGRLEVHIQLADDATNVTINTQHGQTRDMIDNASFKLREFLQENGYQNVNVDVSQQQEQQQQASEQTGDHVDMGDGLAERDSAGNAEGQGNRYFSSDSMVDYFA